MKPKQAVNISDVFRERERKLNARSAHQLDKVRAYVLQDPHFVTLNDLRLSLPLLKGLPLRVPQEDSSLRLRTYHDNSVLSATRSGVEIRIEDRSFGSDNEWPFKQVIKIGEAASQANHTLDRLEFTSKLQKAQPDLENVKGDRADYLKQAFNARSLNKIRIYPLIQIASQRWKLLYHPDGDKDTQIELATDIGRGQTVDGFTWDMFQLEIEMKKGDPAWLEKEEARLMQNLPFLTSETRSKPSPGFDHLGTLLALKNNREIVRQKLKDGTFHILSF